MLDVTFLGISEAGNDSATKTYTETVSVAEIKNALFGTWSGKFNYNVEMDSGYKELTTLTANAWTVPSSFSGAAVWTDGTNLYCSFYESHYVYNNGVWEDKVWKGAPEKFYGNNVWTDGTNIYYSANPDNYVLNGDTWEEKTWKGYTELLGEMVWTDGVTIYYSNYDYQYVLRGDTWEEKTWINQPKYILGSGVWTDGTNFYYSSGTGYIFS